MSIRGLLITPLVLMALSGCGVKGALVKKGEPLPAAPGAVQLQQQGGDALLSWAIPTLNQDGSALLDLQRFTITRLPYRPGDYCDECRDSGSDAIQIHLERPEPAARIGDRLYLRDPGLPLDSGYRYTITPFTAGDKAGASATAHRVLSTPPPAPTELRVTLHDRSVRIDWTLPPLPTDAGEWLGVNVYRATGATKLPPTPVNSEPVTGSHYDDFNLVNGQEYRYALRGVIRIDDRVIESDVSGQVSATPRPEF